MKFATTLTTSVLLAGANAAPAGSCPSDSGLKIKTNGGEVHGFINETAPNVRQFLGVPYAEPPIGQRRFLPPVRKQAVGVIDATAFAPSCMQQTSDEKTVYTEHMQQFLINGGQDEDCLYLNVWAPLNPTEEKLPVFVYIPGGGYTSGGADSLYKIPDKWIERTQSHIFVIMNYRVNVFGFPSSAAQPLNAGLLDQRMVVEWTRDNIAAFGGDPSRIILMGQSAGGGSVHYYSQAYVEDPIVWGLIPESGTFSSSSSPPNPETFSSLAELVGCEGLEATAELSCMQGVDAQLIEDTVSNSSNLSFRPLADGVTAFPNASERYEKGSVAKIPMLTGYNNNEGSNSSPYIEETGPPPDVVAAGNARITCGTISGAKVRQQNGFVTYQYQYEGNFSNVSPLPWIGATHSTELPLIFGTHYEYRGNSTDFEWEVSETMEAFWLSFAADTSSDPTDGNGLSWPKYVPDTNSSMVFARAPIAAQIVDGTELQSICT